MPSVKDSSSPLNLALSYNLVTVFLVRDHLVFTLMSQAEKQGSINYLTSTQQLLARNERYASYPLARGSIAARTRIAQAYAAGRASPIYMVERAGLQLRRA